MGNILVVDDERSIRKTVKAFLQSDGHYVETAAEAESALAIFRNKPMDVVLTDIILPRVSGVELLRSIRDISSQVQVIMMTGEPTLETASEALRLGAVDYLQKPVRKNEIIRAVRNALNIKELNDAKLRLEEENQKYLDHLQHLVDDRTRALAASEAALRRRAEELSIINRLARKVNVNITVEGSIRCGLQEIVKSSISDFAFIFLQQGDDLVLKGMYPEHSGIDWQLDEVRPEGSCFFGLSIIKDEAEDSLDVSGDSRSILNECVQAGFISFAALPLKSGEEIIGVLGIASPQRRDFQDNSAFLEALANELSTGLKKSLLYEQVQQHALELQESLARIQQAEAERISLMQHLQRSQKLEAIGSLASGIAHDFNNILGAVMGYAELALLETPTESRSRESLEMVLTAGNRARDLVKQILAFSRQSEEERKPFQVANTLREVLKFTRASLPATIEIREDIGEKIGNILADPVQIHQVFMNLCTNAHHAMREKGGVLHVKLTQEYLGPEYAPVHPDLKPGPYVKLTVKDTGYGMDEATMAKIFDPYFTTKEKGVGTGLGLAVAHGIVQKHGGAITVASEPGNGSVFTLYFPIIQKEESGETGNLEEIPTGHESILLIDDEQVLVDMGRRMLEHLGYRVEVRTSSVEALALFKFDPQRFDLVITDMTMPNKTGDKLAEELLRLRPDIPIILCTGYSESLENGAAPKGIKAVVKKPILLAKMARAIRQVLDQ